MGKRRFGFQLGKVNPNLEDRPDLSYQRQFVGKHRALNLANPRTLKRPGVVFGKVAGGGAGRRGPALVLNDPLAPNPTTIPFSAPTARSIEILPIAPRRRYLLVQNNSGTTMYVATGRAATLADVQIPPGGNWEPIRAPRSSINVFVTADAMGVCVAE